MGDNIDNQVDQPLVRRAPRPTGGTDACPEHTAETCEQGEHFSRVSRHLRTCVIAGRRRRPLTNPCPLARPTRGSWPLDKVLGHGRRAMMCMLAKGKEGQESDEGLPSAAGLGFLLGAYASKLDLVYHTRNSFNNNIHSIPDQIFTLVFFKHHHRCSRQHSRSI